MLINLRNALMTGKRLPYDAELEYLEGTGTQWIDTGVYGNQDTKIELAISITSFIQTNYSSVFGNYNSSSDSISIFAGRISGSATTRFGNASTNSLVLSAATRYDIVVDKNGVSYNDSTIQWSPSNTFTTNGTLIAFGRNVTTYGLFIGKVYYCKIYAGSILVRDFIPVRKGTVGYLYDRVTRKLFGNAGTGDFVLGPDVVPVEYLESHGTEYIDTGIDAQSCEIRCDFDLGSVNLYETVFGVQSPANNFLEVRRYANNTSSLQVVARNLTTTVAFQSGQNSLVGTWDSSGCYGTLNGTVFSISSGAVIGSAGYHIFLFAANQDKSPAYYMSGKIYSFEMANNGTPFYKPVPVRVGTEGAMMDVLTRRIYRNAGTGAFGYGNDLKYPIPSE